MDPILLVIVAVISLAIGYFTSSIFASRHAAQDARILPPNGSLPGAAKPAVSEVVSPSLESVPTAPVHPAAERVRQEMVILWRELPSGALCADFDGQTVHMGEELTPEQRRRLVQTVKDLRPWLAPAAPPIAVPPSAAVTPPPAQVAPLVAQPVTQPITPPTAPPPVILIPPTPPAAKTPLSPVPPTLVKQIDEILQERIAGTPLDSRGISLDELPDHSVVFKVGLDSYDSVDKIPDAEIAAAYRAAIKQWENRAK